METKFSLKGRGTGTVSVNGTDTDLSFTGTTAATKVSAAVTGGNSTIHNVTADADMRSFLMPGVDANGTLSFAGGLGSLTWTWGGAAGPDLNIAAGHKGAAKLTFRNVQDLDISAAGGIDTFTAAQWLDADATADQLTAPWAKRFNVAGDSDADLLLNGTGAPTGQRACGQTNIGGIVTGKWDIGSVFDSSIGANTIKAAGAENWRLAAGKVKLLDLTGDWDNRGLYAGDSTLTVGTLDVCYVEGAFWGTTVTAVGADASNIAIKKFRVGTVGQLASLTSNTGGISILAHSMPEAGRLRRTFKPRGSDICFRLTWTTARLPSRLPPI